ncbi:MAG: hypothetical protein L3J45_07270 [Flavobacteriaceae bacterium]|nr:hypothetical protein [Flavobacteriaceae bacterium]
MKEYKIIKVGMFKKDVDLLGDLNQSGREGWKVVSTAHEHGRFAKVLLERDKNRMS